MAYKDSDELQSNENYALGEYSFRIERSAVPGSTNDKIEAICTDKDGKNARKSIQIPSNVQLAGWYVEANENTADVYANVVIPPLITVQINQSSIGGGVDPYNRPYTLVPNGNGVMTHIQTGVNSYIAIYASSQTGVEYHQLIEGSQGGTYPCTSVFTYSGKTVYYTTSSAQELSVYPLTSGLYASLIPAIAWTMVYGATGEEEVYLVGRFAIELEDAGGVGPGSDWTDPDDYDDDWEEGDPTHTLYVEVIGALSGRHNDPIVDPSYSYIPADKETVKDYGCGGDGGHGGGGGAGASTVVVHKFATNQANSKEVTAIARRHGYGSGGGKGGKGGDGCILVYY